MAKVALLIGVSDYQISGSNQGFTDLPSAKLDVEGMKRILDDPELGAFDQVTPLVNPRYDHMSREIETFLGKCQKSDLVLLYFSGHGAKHEKTRKLYFAARGTEKNEKDQLITSTAVSAATVRDWLSDCQATKKIMILDCCFSGAIDPHAKGDDTLEALEKSLSAVKGSVILTSSSSTEISYGDSTQMSFYTRHFVRGIETGEADQNSNGFLSIDELHKYVSEKIRVEKVKMNPKIFFLQEEGFYTVPLIKVPIADPRQAYRKKVEAYIEAGYAKNGKFSQYIQEVLKDDWNQINQSSKTQLSLDDAGAVESDLLKPIKQRLDNLEKYRKAFCDNLENSTLDQNRKELKLWQEKTLKLTDTDVVDIEQEEQQRLKDKQEGLRQEAEKQRQAQEQERQREYQAKLQQYEQEFRKAIKAGYPIDSYVRDGLNKFQKSLELSDKDVAQIKALLVGPQEVAYEQRLAEQRREEEAEQRWKEEAKRQLELERQQKLEQQRQEQLKQEAAAKQRQAEAQEGQQREAEQLKQKQAEAERLRQEELERQRVLEQQRRELASEKGVDYTRLRDLLKAGQWKEADEETGKVMLKVAGQEKQGYLVLDDIEQFPCTDLRTIDQLWVKYSDGKFGFSVQKKIWEEVGQNFEKFGQQVGWLASKTIYRERGMLWMKREEIAYGYSMLRYDNLTFSLQRPPEGHLPGTWHVSGVRVAGAQNNWVWLSSLASILVKCNL